MLVSYHVGEANFLRVPLFPVRFTDPLSKTQRRRFGGGTPRLWCDGPYRASSPHGDDVPRSRFGASDGGGISPDIHVFPAV